MSRTDTANLGRWVRRFLLEHLIVERNLSRHTQHSYRDTLRLLIPFVSARRHQGVDRLALADVSAAMLRDFLRYLEEDRHCTVRTRNQRLAALHAFASFVGERCPESIPWCGEIRAVPFKRYDRPSLCYLEKAEIDAVLAAPDQTTAPGRREHGLVLFLYNSGDTVSFRWKDYHHGSQIKTLTLDADEFLRAFSCTCCPSVSCVSAISGFSPRAPAPASSPSVVRRSPWCPRRQRNCSPPPRPARRGRVRAVERPCGSSND